MALFDDGNTKKFLLFVQKFKMMLEDLGTLSDNKQLQYICTLLHVYALHQFDTLCDQVRITTTTNLNRVILSLGTYFFPVIFC